MESHGIVRFRLFGDNPEFNGETVHLIIAVVLHRKCFLQSILGQIWKHLKGVISHQSCE